MKCREECGYTHEDSLKNKFYMYFWTGYLCLNGMKETEIVKNENTCFYFHKVIIIINCISYTKLKKYRPD